MLRIFVLIFFINTLSVNAQTDCDCYERLENLAELRFHEENYSEALKTYKRALSFLPDSARNYQHDFKLALFHLENSFLDSASHFLINAIEGGFQKSYLTYDSRFDTLQKTIYGQEITNAYRKTDLNFNWNLYNEIQRIGALDQSLRSKNGIGSLATDSLSQVKLYSTIDSIVFEKVIQLINVYGYPTQIADGFKENYFLYFLHSSMYSEEKFELILKHLTKQNELCLCSKGNIALLNDRRLDWYYSEKQIAGTWNYPGEFLPIQNTAEVDSIRFKYNLLNLYDYGQIAGKLVPNDYRIIPYPKNYFCEDR